MDRNSIDIRKYRKISVIVPGYEASTEACGENVVWNNREKSDGEQ